MFSDARFSGFVEFSPSFAPRPKISHVIFDYDGTLSWLRHGWPEVMVELFRPHLKVQPGESEAALHEMLLSDFLSLNGKPSVHQMIRGAERVRERGGPPLEPEKLLHEYQRRLDALIGERTEGIVREEARREAFLVHGARALLEDLKRRELTLIILSGTAEPRVKEEAALLDLAHFFGEHIYGSKPDLAHSSKAAVIYRLLREENIAGEHLLSFGDGPVEIELTKEAGGLAVGVASDEDHNGSGRMHPQKRGLLAAAGADVLIPDYRDAGILIERIFGE